MPPAFQRIVAQAPVETVAPRPARRRRRPGRGRRSAASNALASIPAFCPGCRSAQSDPRTGPPPALRSSRGTALCRSRGPRPRSCPWCSGCRTGRHPRRRCSCSSPVPPHRWSLPLPPFRLSSPAPPRSVSAPSSPNSVSLPSPPVSASGFAPDHPAIRSAVP